MAKVTFIQNVWFEYIGIASISAFLKAHGHETDIVLGDTDDVIKKIKESPTDLIGFPCMTIHHEWVIECATKLKESGVVVPIIVGGPHPTFFPEMIEHPSVDIICRGEGELPMKGLADALSSDNSINKIKNFWVKENGKIYKNEFGNLVEDIDSLPDPDRDLYRKNKYFRNEEYVQVLVSRGCPYQCSFCFNIQFNKLHKGHGKTVRHRSADRVIKEIKEIKDKHGVGYIQFIDSTFNLNKRWFLEFFEKYKDELDIPFTCNIRANLCDERTAKALADTGNCVSVRFGVESGNPRVRNEILKKNISDEQLIEARRMYKKYNIPVITYNMFCVPTETIGEAWDTIYLNIKMQVDSLSCYIFQILPGLEISRFALDNGLVSEEVYNVHGRGLYGMNRSALKQKDINEVTNLHHFSVIAVKYPWTIPLVRVLIKFPPSRIFDMIFSISQGIEWLIWSRMGLIRMLKHAIKNYSKFS